jgi:hypothetical protein
MGQKAELVEESDYKRLQERTGHVRKKCPKVSADTLKVKPVEDRECDVSSDRNTQQLPLDITFGNRGAKPELKCS